MLMSRKKRWYLGKTCSSGIFSTRKSQAETKVRVEKQTSNVCFGRTSRAYWNKVSKCLDNTLRVFVVHAEYVEVIVDILSFLRISRLNWIGQSLLLLHFIFAFSWNKRSDGLQEWTEWKATKIRWIGRVKEYIVKEK